MYLRRLVLTGVVGLACNRQASPGAGEAPPAPALDREEARAVEAAYFALEYDDCLQRAALSHAPDAWAWGVLCGVERQPQELDQALALQARIPAQSEWAWFAGSALALAGDEVFGPVPARPTGPAGEAPAFAWMTARTAGAPPPGSVPTTTEPWRTRIRLEEIRGLVAAHPGDQEAIRALLPEVRQLQANGAARPQAIFLEASMLVSLGQHAQAIDVLRGAVADAPESVPVRQHLWRVLATRPDANALRQALLDDVADLRRRGAWADAEWAASYRFDDVGLPELAEQARAVVLDRWPQSAEAEWVRTERRRAMLREAVRQPEGSAERAAAREAHERLYRSSLDETSHSPIQRGEALHERVMLEVQLRPTAVARLESLVDDFLGSYAHRPSRYRTVAWAITRAGIDADRAARVLKRGRDRMRALGKDDESLAALFGLVEASILIRAGEPHDAEQILERVGPLLDSDNSQLLQVRAELALARGDDDPLALEACALDKHCRTMMESSFEPASKGQTFAEWLGAIQTEAAKLRRDLVLSRAAANPRIVPPTALAPIGSGAPVELLWPGGTTILKFTGQGCKPCLREAPALATLARTLDANARIVVVAAHGNGDTVAREVREAGYDGPIYQGEAFAGRQGIASYPTTWFIDASGAVRFEEGGRTKHLVEEYEWRLQAMADGGKPAK